MPNDSPFKPVTERFQDCRERLPAATMRRNVGARRMYSALGKSCQYPPDCGTDAFARSRGAAQERILPPEKPGGGGLRSGPPVEQGIERVAAQRICLRRAAATPGA